MSYANSINEIIQLLPILESIYNRYRRLIRSKKVSCLDLVFTKRISKNSNEYSNRKTIESCVVQLLSSNLKLMHAGEEIKYIITDFYSKTHLERAIPIELIEGSRFNYDAKRYCDLLYSIYNSIISHFK